MANISIYDPRTMGKLVERMPKVQTFIKSTFFRNVETFDTQKIDVDFKKGNRQLAPFVHKKIGGVTIDNEGYETNTYEPPLVAPNKITTVDDILKRTPGESLYGGKSPNQRAVEKMQRDFTELDEMITRREEWMCCQALFTGKIPILDKDGKELQAEIDFQFTNKVTLSGANAWNKKTGGKIKQLKEWRKQVQKKGFVNCNVCLMGADALEAFLMDEEVLKVLDTRRFEAAVIKYNVTPQKATYGKTPVKAAVKRSESQVELAKSFTAQMPNGHIGIYERKSDSSYPIKQLYGPSVPRMAENAVVLKTVEDRVNEVINNRMEHELDRILNGGS